MWFKNFKINGGKLISNDLVSFIMTENCSFQCKHCMRGQRRANIITEEVIEMVLSQVNINGELHLGGGEPLLAIERVIYLLEMLQFYRSKPKTLNIVTNGSVGPKKFESFVAAIPKGTEVKLQVSNDYYHVQERLRLNKEVDNLITRLREYQAIFCQYGYWRPIDDYYWMLEGYKSFRKGKGVLAIGFGTNISGSEVTKRDFKIHKNVCIERGFIKGNFQVQTDGRITRQIDMSWEECDQYYGQEYNIGEKPLQEILTNEHL